MDIQVDGLDKLINKFNELGANADEIVDEGLRDCAVAIQAEAKNQIQKKKAFDNGYLLRSISVEEIPNGYSVGSNLEYAVYNEFGTGKKGDPSVPHTQRGYEQTKDGRWVVRWRYKDKNGKWYTTEGIKPRPFLRPAFKKHYRIAKQAIRTKLLEALNKKIK